jgi:iron-sulfur cluster assembly protein
MRNLMLVVALSCLSCGGQPDTPPTIAERNEAPMSDERSDPKDQQPSGDSEWSKYRVALTPAAANRVKTILKDFSPRHNLRASVRGNGLTGFTHHLVVDDTFDSKMDLVFVSHGVKVVIDKKSALFMGGSVVDWVDDGTKAGFSVSNPNMKAQNEAESKK